MKLKKLSQDFLYRYMNANAPTGFEKAGQEIWCEYINPYVDELGSDVYGSAYGLINPGMDYRVLIEAHADEISWYVNYISDDGFIYVIRNGGSDHTIAPSMRVMIHTDKGPVKGVFGWPAIHTRKGKNLDLAPKLENIFIDIGAKDRKEVEKAGVMVGHVVTFADRFDQLNDRYYYGRAIDNRIGGFMIAEVARMLKEKKVKLPYSLFIVNSVQEEIGLKGAEMIAHTIQPQMALVTDVTHDTSTPLIDKKENGDIRCGRGPVVTVAPAVHNKLLQLVRDVAKKEEIGLQLSAASRSTGTDTDAFAYANGGIPSALISLPLRYMHTTVEMAHIDDINQTILLMFHFLKNFKPDFNFKYF